MNANNIPAGYELVAVKGLSELMYWLDRCSDKGHLENCADLIEPYEAFEWRKIDASAPSTADLVAHETPNASDNGTCVQPASGEVAEAGQVEAKLAMLDTPPMEWGSRIADEHYAVSPQVPAPQAVVEKTNWLFIAAEQFGRAMYDAGMDANSDFSDRRSGSDAKRDEALADLKEAFAALTPSSVPSAAPHQGADALREVAEIVRAEPWLKSDEVRERLEDGK